MDPSDPDLPAVAISSCLLGERVRYDGEHKRHDDLLAWWAGRVRWVPICPEVLAGLGVPRPPLRLVRGEAGTRVEEVRGGADRTDALDGAARRILATLRAERVCGYVAKARSPSCGVGDAAVVGPDGAAAGTAHGRAVAAVRAACPALPIASEAMLATPGAADAFLAEVRRYAAGMAEQTW